MKFQNKQIWIKSKESFFVCDYKFFRRETPIPAARTGMLSSPNKLQVSPITRALQKEKSSALKKMYPTPRYSFVKYRFFDYN